MTPLFLGLLDTWSQNAPVKVSRPSLHLAAPSHVWLDLEAMIRNLPVTKDIFRSRMNTIKDSFKIYYTPRSASGSSTAPKCRFKITSHFSYRSPMGQCQLSLIAYQLARIENAEREVFSVEQVKENRLRYYKDLSGKDDSNTRDIHH